MGIQQGKGSAVDFRQLVIAKPELFANGLGIRQWLGFLVRVSLEISVELLDRIATCDGAGAFLKNFPNCRKNVVRGTLPASDSYLRGGSILPRGHDDSDNHDDGQE